MFVYLRQGGTFKMINNTNDGFYSVLVVDHIKAEITNTVARIKDNKVVECIEVAIPIINPFEGRKGC